jgi:hypothetical protein
LIFSPAEGFIAGLLHRGSMGAVRNKMFGSKKNKHQLYYLLPGMSRANREKRKKIFFWSVAVGLFAAGVVAGIMWLAQRGPQP